MTIMDRFGISKRVFQEKTCVCVLGGKKCLLFGKSDVLCFLETSVFRFDLLPY